MYTLYYLPDACSLAIQVVLHEMKQDVEIIDKRHVSDYLSINPLGTVPVLEVGKRRLKEGAAILLYLLNKHNSPMLPQAPLDRARATQDIMFANASMHPAYSRLFFVQDAIKDPVAKQQAFEAAASVINALWQSVEDTLGEQPFLGGEDVSAADILLAVYSRWGESFPVSIHIGPKAEKMISSVIGLASFQRALKAEASTSDLA